MTPSVLSESEAWLDTAARIAKLAVADRETAFQLFRLAQHAQGAKRAGRLERVADLLTRTAAEVVL